MLLSKNALSLFGSTQSGKVQDNNIFKYKNTNVLHNTKQTALKNLRNHKKRSIGDVGMENDYSSKTRRACGVVKTKLTNNTLKAAKDEIRKLSINLRQVEEQSTFWRRKTLHLQRELLSNQNKASDFSEKVEKLEIERIVLQNKVTAVEEQTSSISDAMKSLIAENDEFKETITNIDEELKVLMEEDAKSNVQVAQDAQVCIALDKALEDTMADLSDRLEEIQDLKKLLAKTTIEKNLIEKEVRKKQIMTNIVDINPNELEDNVNKVEKLQEALEKCMFRIAVITQKNAELRKLKGDVSFTSDQDVDMLEENEKLPILESLCMQRYRKILKEAAEKMVAQEMNDSFFD